MKLGIRAVTEEEKNYVFEQRGQIMAQTRCSGFLYGTFKGKKDSLDTGWDWERDNAEEFKAEFNTVMDFLRSKECGVLSDFDSMKEFVKEYPESAVCGKEGMAYGFRVDSGRYAFLFSFNPSKCDYDFCCGCYVSERLDKHIKSARKGIRFINPGYEELFRLPDGGQIEITSCSGEKVEKSCRYIDEYHVQVGNNIYHICEFAEVMRRCGSSYEPKEQINGLNKQEQKQKRR